MSRPEIIPSKAYRRGTYSWVDLYPKNGRPMRVTHELMGRRGLGVAAPTAIGVIGVAGAIGGLVALLQNAMDDDWAETTVFNSHAKTIHSAMLGIQCLIGGTEETMRDLNGNVVCEPYMPPLCELPDGMVKEWRSLRDGFSQFWAEVSDSFFGPSNAEAQMLKQYARRFAAFSRRVEVVCRRQGVSVPAPPSVPKKKEKGAAPAWLKWTVVGVGGLVALLVVGTVRDVLGD